MARRNATESLGRSASQNESQKHYKNTNDSRRTSPNEPNWSINQSQSSMSAGWDLNNWK
jgi:hypothetical protein